MKEHTPLEPFDGMAHRHNVLHIGEVFGKIGNTKLCSKRLWTFEAIDYLCRCRDVNIIPLIQRGLPVILPRHQRGVVIKLHQLVWPIFAHLANLILWHERLGAISYVSQKKGRATLGRSHNGEVEQPFDISLNLVSLYELADGWAFLPRSIPTISLNVNVHAVVESILAG